MSDFLMTCTDVGLEMSANYSNASKRMFQSECAQDQAVSSKSTKEIPGLHNPVDDDELLDMMADVDNKAGKIIDTESEVKTICDRIDAYLRDWNPDHLVHKSKLVSTLYVAPNLFIPLINGKFALFSAFWLNTFGASSTDVLSDVMHVFAGKSLVGDSEKKKKSGRKRQKNDDIAAEVSPLYTDDLDSIIDNDCTDPNGKRLDDKIKHLLQDLTRNHLQHGKVMHFTKEILEEMKRERKIYMTPKLLSVDKLYHEVFTYLVTPQFSMRLYEEYIHSANVRLVTLDDADHEKSVEKIELAMTGRPISLELYIPIVMRQVHKLMLPSRFIFQSSDSSPQLDQLFICILGLSANDIVYINGLNHLIWFIRMKSSTDVLDKIREVELNHVDEECISMRENRQLASKLKFLWTKMTMMIVWLTLFNMFQPCRSGTTKQHSIDISVGKLDDLGYQSGEVVLTNVDEMGKDCIRMNDYTLYYTGLYYYMMDSRDRSVVYRCKNYKKLIVSMLTLGKNTI